MLERIQNSKPTQVNEKQRIPNKTSIGSRFNFFTDFIHNFFDTNIDNVARHLQELDYLRPLFSQLGKREDPSPEKVMDFLEVDFLHVEFGCSYHVFTQRKIFNF